jgi:hypothetical protein
MIVDERSDSTKRGAARMAKTFEGMAASGRNKKLPTCIIMHVWGGFWRKVHYSAVFADGKTRKFGISRAERLREQVGRKEISIQRRDAEGAEKKQRKTENSE